MIPLVSVAVALMLVDAGLVCLLVRNERSARGTQARSLPPPPPPNPDAEYVRIRAIVRDMERTLPPLPTKEPGQLDLARLVLDAVMQSQERVLASVSEAISKSVNAVQLMYQEPPSQQTGQGVQGPPEGYLRRWQDDPKHATDLSDPSDRFLPPPRRPDQVYMDPNDPTNDGDEPYGVPGLAIDNEGLREAFAKAGMQVPNA